MESQTPKSSRSQSTLGSFSICSAESTMCLRKLLKCSHVMPMSCIAVYLVWLFYAKMNRSEIPVSGAATAASANDSDGGGGGGFVGRMARANILTETRDIGRRYPGPRHRYANVDGEWRRIDGDGRPKPSTPDGGIPHVVHQIWEKDAIPGRFVPWVSSWPRNHPDWEYWLWTPDDVRRLIRLDYGGYLATFDSYESALCRADASRYFILHAFGGLYADLDVQSLRPIDELVDAHPCLLTEETLEHAHLLYFRDPPNLTTAIMACRPGHALFLVAVRALPYARKRFPGDVLHSTGPFFLDAVYRHFVNRSADVAAVRILPPDYLLPTYDPGQRQRFNNVCAGLTRRSAHYLRATCRRWDDERRMINKPNNRSYTTHFWIHITMDEKYWRTVKSVPIDVILNAKTKPAKAPTSNKRRP